MTMYVYADDKLQVVCPVEANDITEAHKKIRKKMGCKINTDDVYAINTPADMEWLLDRVAAVLRRKMMN